jgi:hypothetical protein
MAYTTVGDIITEARVLLQDQSGVRWPAAIIYQHLNMALLESRLIRPDLWRATPDTIPQYTSADSGTTLDFELQYRPALVIYVAGLCQLEDDEGSSDARAAAMLNTFTKKLTGPIGSA